MTKKIDRCSDSKRDSRARFGVESLEPRTMMASHTRHAVVGASTWVPYAHLLQQDVAATNFPALNGAGIGVAIVDRGIDYNHPQIGVSKIVGGWNFRDNNSNTLDDYGHGTGVAGIIAANAFNYGGYDQGVAPQAKLVSLKQESSANIKSALDWIIANHSIYNIQVVNLTDFITDVLPGAEDANVYLPELKTIHDLRIVIISPVGNGDKLNGDVPINNPSLSPYVIGAGGIDLTGGFYDDSRRGAGLDILGPASNVTMPYYLRNKNSVGYDQYDDNYDGTSTLANYAMGTSWAAAYTSGTATLLKQIDPTISPDQILANLKASGDPVVDPMGTGTFPRLNIEKAIELTYKTQDDSYQGNTKFSRATPLGFRRGHAGITGMKLLIGKPDNYSFGVGRTTTIYFNTVYSGPSATPVGQVYNAAGQLQGSFGGSQTAMTLTPGTYYIYMAAPVTTIGTYGLALSTSPAVAKPAVQAVAFSSTSISSASTAGNDTILGKNTTSVFA